jgi:hypothetical protein
VTFAVRTITRSAAGTDIVHRPQRFDIDSLTIGRGADCEIRLPDLAVSLRHARLRQTAPDRVSVESLGSEPFEADGRFTTRAELSLAANPKLIFGSHVLTLAAGTEDEAVLVDVTRQEGAPEAAADKNEEKIFSLAGAVKFGKRPMAWILAVLILALCLVWPVAAFVGKANRTIHADQQWSTGPLSHGHAFLGRNCQACHVKALVAVRDETCLACHRATANPETARQIAAAEKSWGGPEKVSLVHEHAEHARLLRAAPAPHGAADVIRAAFERTFNHGRDRCASCHLEHLADAPVKGTTAPQPPLRSEPVLNNTYGCADCHTKMRRRLGSTKLRDAPNWRHHPEFRPLIARTPIGMSAPVLDRISLVQQPIDYTGLTFSHRQHLSASGGVARMASGLGHAPGGLACADCHRPDRSGKGFLPVEMTRDCASCHSLGYAPGPDGAPRLLPHGHVDKVIATLEGYGGAAAAPAERRGPPGFLERLGLAFGMRPHAAVSGATSTRVRALFAPKGLCSECHATVAPSDPASLDFKVRPVHLTDRFLPRGAFDHSIKAHRLDAAGAPACESCHKASDSEQASDVMLPRVGECATCHGKSRERTVAAASADCAECHSFHAPGEATPKKDRAPPAPAMADLAGASPTPRRLASSDSGRF